ncbi:hypothetical protein AVEN_40585-1, partial [Araneus ventricosus]
ANVFFVVDPPPPTGTGSSAGLARNVVRRSGLPSERCSFQTDEAAFTQRFTFGIPLGFPTLSFGYSTTSDLRIYRYLS